MDAVANHQGEPWPSGDWPADAELHAHIDQFLSHPTWQLEALSRCAAHAPTQRQLAPGSAFVVTGQQPAVGGGPLYTLVKVAHAIALAQRLSRTGHPLIPFFWCASEDHDVGEADHADLITRSGDIRRFHADLGTGRAGLRHRPAQRWWPGLVAHCHTHLGPGPGEAFLNQHAPADAEGMGAWLGRLLYGLYRDYGLWCMEGHVLRPLWHDGLERAIRQWPTAALAQLRTRLTASGLADPFGELAQAPVFSDLPSGRNALTATEAATQLAHDAQVLSPGAALRPILQQMALPAPFYVAGPGEFHYHRFLAPLYAPLAARQPRLVARCSISLVPGWVERGVRGWGRRIEDCATPDLPVSGGHEDAVLADLDAALSRMQTSSAPLPGEWQQRVGSALTRLRRERDRLQASLRRAQRHRSGLPAWGALCSYEFPHGKRQERSMSLFQAIWQHGPGLVHDLVACARSSLPGEHHFLTIDSSHAR